MCSDRPAGRPADMGDGLAGKLQLGQCSQHQTVGRIDRADDFVDPRGRRTERFPDSAKQGVRHGGVSGVEAIGEGFVERRRGQPLHCVQHVLSGFHQSRALFDEAVGPSRAPTRATDGLLRRRLSPRVAITGGGASTAARQAE